MAEKDPERLKNYMELLKRAHGGVEPLMEVAKESKNKKPAKGEPRSGLERMAPSDVPAALEAVEMNRQLPPSQETGLEALINEEIRPAFKIIGGKFEATHRLWTKLTTNKTLKGRIEAAIPSVGRIELPGNRRIPYGGTGFVVGKNLIMTNRHVAEIFASGLGNRGLNFIEGARAGIDFIKEDGSKDGRILDVRKVVMIHPFWDLAILEVEGLSNTNPPITLSLNDARDMKPGHEVFVIGYPAFDPRNPEDAQQKLFEGIYGVKRLQPGALQGAGHTASFGKLVPAAAHDCSTLGGNSGSAVYDLDTGEVLALHFGGLYHEKNFGVPSAAMARDSRIVDAGVQFSGSALGDPNDWSGWWKRADDQQDETAADEDESDLSAPAGSGMTGAPTPPTSIGIRTSSDGSVSIEIPLRITVSLGTPIGHLAAGTAREIVQQDVLEGLKVPFHEENYTGRKGYDPSFLDEDGALVVPMPVPDDSAVLAPVKGGGAVLKYQNFSICMHAKRRVALFTASNITEEEDLRKPEKGKDYSRKGLSGLRKNDQEKWFTDPRISADHQLPDVFFTKDRQAFDKGHIVRRDDIAWGKTYAELRRANGDSYHVTNCSPQVADFNRSNLGDENWGDLENHVLSEAASERLCVFAGPVLDSNDRIFVGVGDNKSAIRARIPSRFWKLVVARVEDGIAAYGFLLEQDLSDVEWEFAVAAEFVPFLCLIADLEELAGVKFDKAIHVADQYETSRGDEVGRRAGARRKKRKKS